MSIDTPENTVKPSCCCAPRQTEASCCVNTAPAENTTVTGNSRNAKWLAGTLAALLVWAALYSQLVPFS